MNEEDDWEEIIQLLEKLALYLKRHKKHCYAVHLREDLSTMSNGIQAGSSGTFNSQLLDNGSPIAIPSGAVWAWTADDSGVTFAPVATDPTGGTQTASVPAGDPGTSVTITASTTDPAGATVSGTITVPITAAAQKFTVSVTQI